MGDGSSPAEERRLPRYMGESSPSSCGAVSLSRSGVHHVVEGIYCHRQDPQTDKQSTSIIGPLIDGVFLICI